MLSLALLVLVILFLIKFADVFTETAEKIGIKARLSPFVVGVLIVSIGTSLPELVTSSFASFYGFSEFVFGNVLGSNIANILLIFGLSAIIGRKLYIRRSIASVDLPVFIAAVVLLFFVAYDGKITFFESILLLTSLMIYLHYVVDSGLAVEEKILVNENYVFLFSLLFISGFFVVFLSKLVIDLSLIVAKEFNVALGVISATIVAIGTSLPELTVSVVAARKGKGEIVFGNIVGSNIFNIFAIIGVSGLINPLSVPNNIYNVLFPSFIATSVLFFFMAQDREVTKWEGLILIVLYLSFVLQLF